MNKRKIAVKKILIGIVGILLVVIVIGVVAIYNLGTLIEKAVNHYGPQYTKTDVAIGDVDVALRAGKAELQNFLLGNPEGYTAETAMKVRSIRVDLNEKTLTDDPLVIEEIRVVDPIINYEVKGKTDNFRTILNNVRQAAGKEKAAEKKPEPGVEQKPPKKVVIKDFYLTGGEVTMAMAGLQGKDVRATIPDIHLENIGGSGGIVPAEALAIILDQIYKQIQSGKVRNALNRELEKHGVKLDTLREDLQKGAGEAVRKGLQDFLGE